MLSLACTFSWPALAATADGGRAPQKHEPWADWIERDSPFISSVVDARKSGDLSIADNLTPRGLVLKLGDDLWACFDTEMLRVSAVWRGDGVTMRSGSQISYQDAGRKSADGQLDLPTPNGRVWLANGLYPGWQTGSEISLHDPRTPAPSPEEVGRGPLPEGARFRAIRLTKSGACLEYTVGGVRIKEVITGAVAGGKSSMQRIFRVAPSGAPLLIAVALKGMGAKAPRVSVTTADNSKTAELLNDSSCWVVRVQPHERPIIFRVDVFEDETLRVRSPVALPPGIDEPATTRWPESVVTRAIVSETRTAYVVDVIPLPVSNPWRRNVRLADIQFVPGGARLCRHV